MANWYSDQLTNKNFLSPIGFLFLLDKARKTSFLCQKANLPTMILGDVDIPTRGFVPLPVEGNMRYQDLTIEFIVDEDLRNYMELHNWMRALGTPQSRGERNQWQVKWEDDPSEDSRFSDATLQVLNNNNLANFDVIFKQLFPVELSSLPFDVTSGDNNYLTATATFRYILYEIRNVNTTIRR
tara:strand:+ start:421 stop:969 length:549 start_codon:yes stop_codon:yes gene_type:complete